MRHRRGRSKIYGTTQKPRLCVFRSNRYIYAQLIDDSRGQTLVAARVQEVLPKIEGKKEKATINKTAVALEIGKLLAQKALERGIRRTVFDRGGYKYHGRVKAVAEGARAGGLEF